MNNRIQHTLFFILIISVFILLSVQNSRQNLQIDISTNQHNSLNEKSRLVLSQFNQPIHFTAYANDHVLIRQRIQQWFNRYQQVKPDITLEWVNPEKNPSLARNLGISVNGTLIISANQQQKKIETISESSISNALYQILNTQQKKLVFITGHGERNPKGIANHDWLDFTTQLKKIGIPSETRQLLTQQPLSPQDEILVLASPVSQLFEQEQKQIHQFIQRGGNALFIVDPHKNQPLASILKSLRVAILPGTIVDVNTQNLGISQVDFAIVSQYTPHPLTKNFKQLSLYPQAAALDILVDFELKKMDWDIYPFLTTQANSWTETGKIEGQISYNPKIERAGPLDIGLLLSRTHFLSQQQQRIVVLGDGDFLANAYLGNAGNLALGQKIIQWLSSNDETIKISTPPPTDLDFELNNHYRLVAGIGLLVVLPSLLLLIGFIIQLRRRKR